MNSLSEKAKERRSDEGTQAANGPMTAVASPRRPMLATPGEPLRVDVLTSFEDAQAIADEWNALIDRLNESLYMTFDWCRIWWAYYGIKRELRVFVVRRGHELVGIIPLFLDRIGMPGFRARVAKIVGCDFTLALVNLPIDPKQAAEALVLAVQELIARDRCDMICLGPISQQSPQLKAIRESLEDQTDQMTVIRDRECGSHTVFELPDGFDAYLKTLSKNQRSNYKRNVNKLNGAFNFRIDVLRDWPALESEFEQFVEMHQSQWQAVNKLGHFGDWPDSLAFTRDLVRQFSSGAGSPKVGGVRLIRLIADEKVVSYYFCFELNGTVYWRLPARLIGSDWDSFALGRVGLFKMLEAASVEGATAIEAGNGWYEYKEKLNAKTIGLRSMALVMPSFASRVRARTAIALGDLLNFAYYRIWFSRVAPKLGRPLRPLWRSWIRSRF